MLTNIMHYIPDYEDCLPLITQNVEYIRCHLKRQTFDKTDQCRYRNAPCTLKIRTLYCLQYSTHILPYSTVLILWIVKLNNRYLYQILNFTENQADCMSFEVVPVGYRYSCYTVIDLILESLLEFDIFKHVLYMYVCLGSCGPSFSLSQILCFY